MDARGAEQLRALSRHGAGGLRKLVHGRVTVGFDGAMLGTKQLAEGTAVGYNPAKKGQCGCWPPFATVAQTGQALVVLHHPGNVADSAGLLDFIGGAVERLRAALPKARLENAHIQPPSLLHDAIAAAVLSRPDRRLARELVR